MLGTTASLSDHDDIQTKLYYALIMTGGQSIRIPKYEGQ
jgi:hypothetical protein